MEVFEALMALTVAVSAVSLFLFIPTYHHDFSLIQYVNAEDVWRVLYLRHGLGMFYPNNITGLSDDVYEMSNMAYVCIDYSTFIFSTQNGCDNGIREKVKISYPLSLPGTYAVLTYSK